MLKTILATAASLLLVVSMPASSLSTRSSQAGDGVKRNGVVQTRWPNGVLRSEIGYRNDEYDGVYKTWYESGKPYEVRRYQLGHEAGQQQAWSETGELYINYEARNGRRYGLLNSTPCLPVDGEASALPYYDEPAFTPRWTPVSHRVGAFGLTTQTGARISEASLNGRIHVASFIFTQCAAVCPLLVAQLSRVQRAIQSPDVLLVSYSVTPENDTPSVLADFGKARGIDPARWWLVTGARDTIYNLARSSYFADDSRVGPAAAASSEGFLHTEKVLLVDANRHLRGVYNGTQPHEIDQLIDDITRLRAER